jgi:nitrite reductase/ring-hydroxylating ferredoxin subunit
LSIFVSSPVTRSLAGVPFQPFGFFAFVILFLMAATSHDFWLANLTAPVWKTLHMLVYFAYGLLVLHVTFGVMQGEGSPVYVGATGLGLVAVVALHSVAARRERAGDKSEILNQKSETEDGYVEVCTVNEIPENRARITCLSGERVAIFKYDGKISAVSNVCQHQNGPLGEGKIVSGCITCPWHGYQYEPDTGASPPPFVEKVPTFNVRVKNGRVFVHPKPNLAGKRAEPGVIEIGNPQREVQLGIDAHLAAAVVV